MHQEYINFNDLTTEKSVINDKTHLDPYLKVKSLNNIHEYNLAYLRLVKTLKPTKILSSYYLLYYTLKFLQSFFKYFIYVLMIITYLILFLSNLNINLKFNLIFFIGFFYTSLFLFGNKLTKLDLSIQDFNSSLIKPILFFLPKHFKSFFYLTDKSTNTLRSPPYIHVLSLLKDFNEKQPSLTKNLGIFDLFDFDTFLHVVSSNNQSYLRECFVLFGLYLKEFGQEINKFTNTATASSNFSEEEESEFINISLKNDNDLPDNPVLNDQSFKTKIYEENIWKIRNNKSKSLQEKILSLYSKQSDDGLINSLKNIKDFL